MKKHDYKIAQKKISNYLLDKNIIAAYEYGSYKNPGLSDIDLFIVVKNIKYNSLGKIVDDLHNGDLKFFFEYSTVMVTDKILLKNIVLFDNLKVKKIFGNSLKIFKYNKYKEDLSLLSIIEWLPERTLRLQENINNFSKINLRQHLGLLNSLKFTYIKLNSYFKDESIKLYSKKIVELRNKKNVLYKKKEILNLSKEILKYTKSLIFKFAKYLVIRKYNANLTGKATMTFPNNSKIIFTKDNKKNNNKNSLNVPLIYSLPFVFHLNKKNTLSKILKTNFKLSKNYKINLKNKNINFILNKRSKLISNNIDLLLKNNIYKGLYKFGWYLNKNEKRIK